MDYRKKALKYQKRYNELLQMRGGAGRPFGYNEFKPGAPGHSSVNKTEPIEIELADDESRMYEEFLEEQRMREMEQEMCKMEQEAERDIFLDEASRVADEEEHERIQALIRAQDQERERRQRAAASSELTLTPVIPSAFLTESPQPRSRVQQQVTATPMPVRQTPRSRTPERVEESVTATPVVRDRAGVLQTRVFNPPYGSISTSQRSMVPESVTATPVRPRVQESRTSTPGRPSRFDFSSVRDTLNDEASTPMEPVRPRVQESRTSTPGRRSRFDFSSVRDKF